MTAVPELARLVRMLSLVEVASADGATLVEFPAEGGEVAGRLVAEESRICWAAAPMQSVRIGDIFAEECGIGRDELEDTFRTAREAERPFGEELVRRGMAKEEDLQRCLRRQTLAAAMTTWAAWTGSAWSQQEMNDGFYDPAYTVKPLELLRQCMERLRGDEEGFRAPSEPLSALAARAAAAACFRETTSEEFPFVPIVWFGLDTLSIRELLAVGRNAVQVAQPVALAAGAIHPHAVLVHREGVGIICAVQGSDLWVFEIGDRAQYGEVMAHLQALARGARP